MTINTDRNIHYLFSQTPKICLKLGPCNKVRLPSVALNEGTFFFVHEAIIPVELFHGLHLRLKQPSRRRIGNIVIKHTSNFATNRTIVKNLTVFSSSRVKLSKKIFD